MLFTCVVETGEPLANFVDGPPMRDTEVSR